MRSSIFWMLVLKTLHGKRLERLQSSCTKLVSFSFFHFFQFRILLWRCGIMTIILAINARNTSPQTFFCLSCLSITIHPFFHCFPPPLQVFQLMEWRHWIFKPMRRELKYNSYSLLHHFPSCSSSLSQIPHLESTQLSLSFHISEKKKRFVLFSLFAPSFCRGIARIYIQITLFMNHKLANRPPITYRRDVEILRPFLLQNNICCRNQPLLH